LSPFSSSLAAFLAGALAGLSCFLAGAALAFFSPPSLAFDFCGVEEAGLFFPTTLSSPGAATGASLAYFSLKARISLSYLSFSLSEAAL
jgi:hypothetical protein